MTFQLGYMCFFVGVCLLCFGVLFCCFLSFLSLPRGSSSVASVFLIACLVFFEGVAGSLRSHVRSSMTRGDTTRRSSYFCTDWAVGFQGVEESERYF